MSNIRCVSKDAAKRAHAAAASAISVFDQTSVHLDRVCAAKEVIEQVGKRRYLHAGPPIPLEDVPGPMRGALVGGLLFEGEAKDVGEAQAIIDGGELTLVPCHDAGAVGPMAGVITPSMPVVVARSAEHTSFAPLNEGIGGAVRYGSFDDETLGRLRWMATEMSPVLDDAIQASERIDLVDLVAEGLRRGDECHNRLVATTATLVTRLAPALMRTAKNRESAAAVALAMAENGHFALPFAISMAKALTLAAAEIADSPIVTAMAGNGQQFGIRVGGTGEQWFLAPAPIGEPKLVPGASLVDVTPTMGDSMIAETVGFGAFAMTAAPAIMSFVGGTVEQAQAIVAEMRGICAGTSSRFLLPAEAHKGTPIGIDVHKVRETRVAPVINNGMAHRLPGRGRVAAGITRVPLDPFIAASEALMSMARSR